MRASTLSFQAAPLLVLVGMGWGIAMAVSGDHATAPGHAHLNLLGWVSLFLFGIFYRLHPVIDRTRAACAQVWVWIASSAVMALGVGLIHAGREIGEPLAAISSIVIFLDMAFFAVLVFRHGRESSLAASGVPAE